MKQPPSTRTVFLVLLLVLAGAAIAGGAVQTISETLGHSVQPDRLPPSVPSQSQREQPVSLVPSPAPFPRRVPLRRPSATIACSMRTTCWLPVRHWSSCRHWPASG